MTTLAGSEAGYEDGPVSDALFEDPAGIVLNDEGYVFVSDGGEEGRIRVITPSGMVHTVASDLTHPMGLCYSNDTLYLAEKGKNVVIQIDISYVA